MVGRIRIAKNARKGKNIKLEKLEFGKRRLVKKLSKEEF